VRSVLNADAWALLPGATYHHRVLTDEATSRVAYFSEAWDRVRGVPLLFLDPDNGLEVPSVRYGGKNSGKYLYWHEAEEAFARGHSLVIYQHFPHEKRETFVQRLEKEVRHRLGEASVEAYRTAQVVFLIAMRPEHADAVSKASEMVARRWEGQIHGPVRAIV
jgi:hypothetical protein